MIGNVTLIFFFGILEPRFGLTTSNFNDRFTGIGQENKIENIHLRYITFKMKTYPKQQTKALKKCVDKGHEIDGRKKKC